MPAQFSIDDPVPGIVLAARSGALVNLADQNHAGTAHAFWITGADAAAAGMAEAEHLASLFAACDAALIHVVTAEAASKVPAPAGDVLVQLFDPKGALSAAVGLDGPGIVLIDRSGRLRAVSPDGTPAAALDLCRSHHTRAAAGAVGTHPPVLLIARVLEPELRRELIAYWQRGPKEENAVAQSAGGNQVAAGHLKRRSDVVIQDRALYESVKRRIERRVAPEMLKTLQFTAARMEALRIGCYDAANNGEFGRHRDNMTPYTAHRKFAMSLNLNGGDYEGGALAFPEYGRQVYVPDAGDAVIFSCSLLHQALPVTKGRRFGVFTFFTDRAGAEQEDAMLAARRDKIKEYAVD